jgi:hypothetical protein
MAQNVVNASITGLSTDSPLATAGAAIEDALSFLEYVPAMLLIFPSAKVPVPIPVPIMFKPEKLSFSKGAGWRQKYGSQSDVPQVSYKGGEPEKLKLDLFFDTTATSLDVRLYVKPIQMLVYRVPFLNQPPLVMFSWGTLLSKQSYVDDVDIEYTMFLPNGTPVRAEVRLSLIEYDRGWLNLIPMNPTSVSEARKTWVVHEGQTLDWIAYEEYGDPSAWRHIAQTNNLDNPMELRPGQILKLTPLP